jgi:DNA polymerase I-like protein with 3'-5' exonuclease and polymerase domains
MSTGRKWPRGHIKNVGFGIIYGSGPVKQADQLGLDVRDPEVVQAMRDLKRDYLSGLPGVGTLVRQFNNDARHHVTPALLQRSARVNVWAPAGKTQELLPIWTIGGRICFVEPPELDDEEEVVRTYSYKLVNTAVQGSAGDQLKEAIVQLGPALRVRGARILLTAHDELLIAGTLPDRLRFVRDVLEHTVSAALMRPTQLEGDGAPVPFVVPMIAEGVLKHKWSDKGEPIGD